MGNIKSTQNELRQKVEIRSFLGTFNFHTAVLGTIWLIRWIFREKNLQFPFTKVKKQKMSAADNILIK